MAATEPGAGEPGPVGRTAIGQAVRRTSVLTSGARVAPAIARIPWACSWPYGRLCGRVRGPDVVSDPRT
ncbi:hypothetical protein EES46_01630 [Streptomyces sp. ADI98-10]|nr:hypothetical protein EES46_01630 [Streptomyces sp. ADI98-10]